MPGNELNGSTKDHSLRGCMGCGCEPRQKQAVSTVWMPNQPCGEDGNHVLFLGNIGSLEKGQVSREDPGR